MAAPAAGLEAMRAYAATGGVGAVELGQLCALRESAEALSTTLEGVGKAGGEERPDWGPARQHRHQLREQGDWGEAEWRGGARVPSHL